RDIPKLWSELSKENDLDLVVCIAAAQRRGMMDADEAKRQGFEDNNLNEGFRISGLGQLIEAGIESDRLVVFGA
ncbi:tRNA 5-methylaminomethyl-2-thiouridine synthase subunit TusD, partial [hydrothermal vent metagenome]